MTLALATSGDGKWAAARDDHQLLLFAADAGPPIAELELASADVDLALVGAPAGLVVVTRNDRAATVTLARPPSLDAVARLELAVAAKLAATTGPCVALAAIDPAHGPAHVVVVRATGTALVSHRLEVAEPIEFAVGLERNQLLFGLRRQLEVWDAVSGRRLRRPQLELPPPPRKIGAALGHLWAVGQGSEHLAVYRLSDGRPFQHEAPAPILDVIGHVASPVIVLITSSGLVRLHCHAHRLTMLERIPEPRGALALWVDGDELYLVGLVAGAREPWRIRVTRP